MSYIQDIMKHLMDFIFQYTKSYGLAIIVMTALIKLILMPLSFHQFKSIKKMQELAPEQQKLQEKYKHNKEKLNEEIMKLYQKNNINPMSGCLPLLIQFPFIIGLFRVLQNYDFKNASFLWVKDLGAPDSTYILPVLAALTTFLSTKISTPSDMGKQNQSTGIVMSLMIGWMALRFPSGLAIYWVVSNLVQMLQQFLITRSPIPAKEDVK